MAGITAVIEAEYESRAHKRHPIPRPYGRVMVCLLWGLWRKLTLLKQHHIISADRHFTEVFQVAHFSSWEALEVVTVDCFPLQWHHMSIVSSQVTGHLVVCSMINSGWQQRKHQSSTSIALYVGWIHIKTQIAKFMGPTWDSPGSCWPQMGPMLAPLTLLSGKVPVMQKTLPCLDSIMSDNR